MIIKVNSASITANSIISFEVKAKNPEFLIDNGVEVWIKKSCNNELYSYGKTDLGILMSFDPKTSSPSDLGMTARVGWGVDHSTLNDLFTIY